jgi:hypothetical protein
MHVPFGVPRPHQSPVVVDFPTWEQRAATFSK